MKKALLSILFPGALLIVILTACGNKKAETVVSREDSTAELFSWEAVLNDSTGNVELVKKEDEFPDSLSVQAVVDFINHKNPGIVLQFIRTSSDTLFLSIPEATYLTQQMGSTGPTLFFAEAVYNLTEIPGIRFIHFDFDEGDHAQPGTYTREDFRNQ